jgi:hypothetical protein
MSALDGLTLLSPPLGQFENGRQILIDCITVMIGLYRFPLILQSAEILCSGSCLGSDPIDCRIRPRELGPGTLAPAPLTRPNLAMANGPRYRGSRG